MWPSLNSARAAGRSQGPRSPRRKPKGTGPPHDDGSPVGMAADGDLQKARSEVGLPILRSVTGVGSGTRKVLASRPSRRQLACGSELAENDAVG